MAKYARELYGDEVKFIDLQDYDLPFCDGDTCYENDSVKELKQFVEESKSAIIASPIYMYDLNAVAKNFIELTGRAWTNKVVGFICAAGGKGSYMSVTSFMNSLMLDFRCVIIPRFVYTDGSGFNDDNSIKNSIKDRIKELVDESISISSSI
tara:strand:- start:519 stop:974 length:456 start_codon:yes stop_codon:yes gene_type:complete